MTHRKIPDCFIDKLGLLEGWVCTTLGLIQTRFFGALIFDWSMKFEKQSVWLARYSLTRQTERFEQSWFCIVQRTHPTGQIDSSICDQNYSLSFSFILCDVLFSSFKRHLFSWSASQQNIRHHICCSRAWLANILLSSSFQ